MQKSKITAVDFFDDLSSSYARRWFFWGFIFLSVICLAVVFLERKFMGEGILRDVIDGVAMQVLTGALIIIAFYWIYVYFIGPNPGIQDVTAVRPRDIKERMEGLPLGVRNYTFWGRSGSYFRSYPLLKMNQEARDEKRNIVVEVVLPDPNEPSLVEAYQGILNSLGEKASGSSLLENVLATTLACAITDANNKYISIRIFYSKFLPAFRVDLSDNGAILTQDDPRKSALFFEPNSEFYDMFRNTVKSETAMSREVKWDDALFKGRGLDEKSCDKETLNAFGIAIADVDKLQQDVAVLITKRPHRY